MKTNQPIRRRAERLQCVCATALLLSAPALHAATTIKTDASFGNATTLAATASNTTVKGNRGTYTVRGNVYTLTPAQGRLVGANLFYSFDTFNLGADDAAVFVPGLALNNVVSRVSSTVPTAINGLLALNPVAGNAPSFFFINPNGITVGAGAQVDVPAALHLSTASTLKFADGTLFRAGVGADSNLSISAPERFGFVSSRPIGTVTINNLDATGVAGKRPALAAAPGATLDIVAGNVQLNAIDLSTSGKELRVNAAGGLNVDVPLSGSVVPLLGGTIDAASATLAATGAGAVRLASGSLILRNGTVVSANAGGIAVNAGSVELSGAAKLATQTRAQSAAGPIIVQTDRLSLRGAVK